MKRQEILSRIDQIRTGKYPANSLNQLADEIALIMRSIEQKEPEKRSGTSIRFDAPATYGLETTETAAVTLDTNGFTSGLTQILIHSDSDPNLGSVPQFKIISGEYNEGSDNVIMLHALSPELILVTISQIP